MDFVSFDDIDIKGCYYFFLLIFLFSLTFLVPLKLEKKKTNINIYRRNKILLMEEKPLNS
jgi:hypothetical protein